MQKKLNGRKKGSLNKRTILVKNALQQAFDKIGGVDALVKFGKKNPLEFYKLWVKILPVEIKSTIDNQADIQINLKNSKFNKSLIENNVEDIDSVNNEN